MIYGIKESEFDMILDIFNKYPEIQRVILYGSRAKGNYKQFSDVDITLVGDMLTNSIMYKVSFDIDDLLLPYQFDISIFKTLSNQDLIEHIKRKGVVIYSKVVKNVAQNHE